MIIPPIPKGDGEIIPLPKRDADGVVPLLSVAHDAKRLCMAHTFSLDEQTRTAKCKLCERLFDPFEAIMYLARRWSTYETNRGALKRECEGLEKQREELRRQVQNLKAQAKRAGGQ